MPRLSLALLNSASKNFFNFPKKYVERQIRLGEVYGHHQRFPNERPPQLRVYDEHRPWELSWAHENYPDEGMVPGEGFNHDYERAYDKLPAVEPIKDPVLNVGDRVEVQVGKDKGKIGIIRQIIEERNWCYVEGLNTEYKYEEDYCQRQEKPLLTTTQVKLVDPVDERGCEVEWRYTEDGERVRVSRRSGRILPVPEVAKATADYMAPESYTAGPKDTDAGKVILVTYAPKLMTVEDDILDSVGIVETKKRGKTYWY